MSGNHSKSPRMPMAASEVWSVRRLATADWTSEVLALVFVLAVVGVFHPNFLAPGQLINVVQSSVYAALIAAGLVFLIPQNEIDLSVGGSPLGAGRYRRGDLGHGVG
jgi:predicted ABC-type sugar transport system permease subunit